MDSQSQDSPQPESGHRVLAAIVFTDAVAFTKRTGEDEERAILAVKRDHALMADICVRCEGEVLKSMGDGLLMKFTSAVQAVTAAMDIQQQLHERSKSQSPRDRLQHRIGIHLGDVFLSEHDAMGEGVNIAARLEPLAAPGGICLSQTVYDVVKRRLTIKAWDDGLKRLKNVSEPIQVYQVAAPGQPTGAVRQIEPATPVSHAETSDRNPLLLFGAIGILVIGVIVLGVTLIGHKSTATKSNEKKDTGLNGPLANRIRNLQKKNSASQGESDGANGGGTSDGSGSSKGSQQPEVFDDPTGPVVVADFGTAPAGMTPSAFDSFLQARQQFLTSYDFDGMLHWISGQDWRRLPVGDELDAHYTSLSAFKQWLTTELSSASEASPIVIHGRGQTSSTASVWMNSSGQIEISGPQMRGAWDISRLKPAMIYAIATAHSATSLPPANPAKGIRLFAGEYGLAGSQ